MFNSKFLQVFLFLVLFFVFGSTESSGGDLPIAATPSMIVSKVNDSTVSSAEKCKWLKIGIDNSLVFTDEQRAVIKEFLHDSLVSKSNDLEFKTLVLVGICDKMKMLPDRDDKIIKTKVFYKNDPELVYLYLCDYRPKNYQSLDSYTDLMEYAENGEMSMSVRFVILMRLYTPPIEPGQTPKQRRSRENDDKYEDLATRAYYRVVSASDEMLVNADILIKYSNWYYFFTSIEDYMGEKFSRAMALKRLQAIANSNNREAIVAYLSEHIKYGEELEYLEKDDLIQHLETIRSSFPDLSDDCNAVTENYMEIQREIRKYRNAMPDDPPAENPDKEADIAPEPLAPSK